MEFEEKEMMLIPDGLRATLRNLSDCLVLAHSLNRVYLVRSTPSPKFLASLGTSDILGTLAAICGRF